MNLHAVPCPLGDLYRVRARAQNPAKAADDETAQLRRFTYNPLLGRPTVAGFRPCLLWASPQLVWREATPAGIDHTWAYVRHLTAEELGTVWCAGTYRRAPSGGNARSAMSQAVAGPPSRS